MPVSVGAIMKQPVVVVRGHDTLEHVARLMREQGARCVAVTGDDGRCAGVIREEEFTAIDRHLPFSVTESAPKLFGEWVNAQHLEEGYAAARAKKAADVMVSGHVTTEDERLSQVLPSLQRGHVLLVVRDGVPVGTLSRHDLLKLIAPDDVPPRTGPPEAAPR